MQPNAPPITEDLWVFVHVLDTDGELLWTDDHQPPTPTREWRPGNAISYTRTMFVPKLPFIGEARVELGIYSPKSGDRLPLAGQNHGMRSYEVGALQIRSRPESTFVVFRSGWHAPETGEGATGVEWQWTRREGVISFRNPKQNATLFLEVDQPVPAFPEPQRVDVRLGDATLDSFSVKPGERYVRRIELSPERLGTADTVEVAIQVDKTFTPATLPQLRNSDSRELGVRVFRAHVEPK